MIAYEDYLFLSEYFSFLGYLSKDETAYALCSLSAVPYPAGKIISNSTIDEIGPLFLKQGTLRVYLMSKEGREITLYRLHPGDICILTACSGLQSMILNIQVKAETDCKTLKLEMETFSVLCEHGPQLKAFFGRLLNRRFSTSLQVLERILFVSLKERLAIFLLEELQPEMQLQLHMTHDQIASYMGSSREVVTRELAVLVDAKIIKLSRGTVEILNLSKLKHIAYPLSYGH